MVISIKEKFLLFLISLLLLLVIVFTWVFSFFSYRIYDYFLNSQLKNKSSNSQIVLITVDKKTTQMYWDQSFWTRTRYSKLLNNIQKYKPKVVYFDYYFSDKTNSESVDWDLLESTTNLPKETVDLIAYSYYNWLKEANYQSFIDSDFANTLKLYDNIVLPKLYKVWGYWLTQSIQLEPLSIFSKPAKTWFVNIIPDEDWVVRNLNLSSFAKPVSQVISELYLFWSSDYLLWKSLDFTQYIFSWKIFINYYSEPYSRYVSIPFQNAYNWLFYDYYGNKIDLNNKIILIWDYDESFWDVYKTPVSNWKLTPWIEVIANQIQTFLDNWYIFNIDWIIYILLILLLLILSFLFVFIISSYFWIFVFFVLFTITSFYSDKWLFNNWIYIDFIWIFFSFFIPYLLITIYKLYIHNKERNNIRKFFSKYVESWIVEEMIKNRTIPELGWTKKLITTLFTDLEWFTTITEKLPPDETIKVLNNIFARCNKVIFANSWTLDKYIWDAIMAFWWAPKELEMWAVLACKTALEMQDEIRLYNSWNINNNLPNLNFRFWISTWEVIVWSIWNEQYSDYTVIWDKVNLASRLEWINKYYSTNILICENTYNLVKDKFYIREIDLIKVKWKNEPTRIFELLAMKWEKRNFTNIQDLIINQEEWLKLYREMKWQEALNYFNSNFNKYKDNVAKVFIDRIENYKRINLKDWDWSFSFYEK